MADKCATAAERSPLFSRPWHSRGDPLQLEEGLAVAGRVVQASKKDPEGWGAADKFTVVLETAGLNATEVSAYCRERGLYPEQVERWRQASQDANNTPTKGVPSLADWRIVSS